MSHTSHTSKLLILMANLFQMHPRNKSLLLTAADELDQLQTKLDQFSTADAKQKEI